MGMYLTYDNKSKQDGIGAQLQRIFGIYSITRKFRFGYIHTGISNTAEELAHNLSSESEMRNLLTQVNSLYKFPSDVNVQYDKEILVHNLTIGVLISNYLKSILTRKNILLKVCLPFGIMDKHPDWYEFAGAHFRTSPLYSEAISRKRVVVHVRHGYKPIAGKNHSSAPRFLPLSYYSDALKNVLENESLSLDSEVLIHTDIPEKSGQWKPFQKSKLRELSTIGYEMKDNTLNVESFDLKESYFRDFPNLKVKYCAPILETLSDMASADVLLISRSSFSYIAGIMNVNTVYIPRYHGHAKLSRWKWDYPKKLAPKIELLSGI